MACGRIGGGGARRWRSAGVARIGSGKGGVPPIDLGADDSPTRMPGRALQHTVAVPARVSEFGKGKSSRQGEWRDASKLSSQETVTDPQFPRSVNVWAEEPGIVLYTDMEFRKREMVLGLAGASVLISEVIAAEFASLKVHLGTAIMLNSMAAVP